MRVLAAVALLMASAALGKEPRRNPKPLVPKAAPPKTVLTPEAPKLKLVPPPATFSAKHGTACASCHVTSSWSQVRFNHESTGFPLRGQHAQRDCKLCHPATFQTPVPTGCAGCHLDVHAGDLGQRCESCHDERTWQSEFSAEAHRRSNFPLLGGHAVLPCVECHVEARERRFTRSAAPCVNCHRGDLARTAGTPLDHTRLAFGENCLSCHSGIRFKPARFVTPFFTHDTCFLVSAGPHASVSCESCHGNGIPESTGAACTTRSATCTNCHTHQCAGPGGSFATDVLHADVQGYQCRDTRCSECHPQGAEAR